MGQPQPLDLIPGLQGCRLSLSSTDPVGAPNLTSATVYLLPYAHDRISLYRTTGARWITRVVPATGVSLSISGLAANTVWDIFALLQASNSIILEAIQWTSLTARAQALQQQDGIYTINTGIRRYLGTIRIGATAGQASITTAASGSTPAQMSLWNSDNRVLRRMTWRAGITAWSPTAASTWQNLGGLTPAVQYVLGRPADSTLAVAQCTATPLAAKTALLGIGVDGTVSPAAASTSGGCTGAASFPLTAYAEVTGVIGARSLTPIAWSDDTGTVYRGNAQELPGLVADILC